MHLPSIGVGDRTFVFVTLHTIHPSRMIISLANPRVLKGRPQERLAEATCRSLQ
jgi:hypothetical protein